jgi:hypothetical protein
VSVVPSVRFLFLVVGVVCCLVVGLLLGVVLSASLRLLLVLASVCALWWLIWLDDWLLYVCCCGPCRYRYRLMAAFIRDQGKWVCGVVGVMFVGSETAVCGVYFTCWGLSSRAESCCSKFVPALFAAYDGVLLSEGESGCWVQAACVPNEVASCAFSE